MAFLANLLPVNRRGPGPFGARASEGQTPSPRSVESTPPPPSKRSLRRRRSALSQSTIIPILSLALGFAVGNPARAGCGDPPPGPFHTWVVTYVGSGTWSQDDLRYNPTQPAQASNGPWENPDGQTSGGNSAGDQYAVDATTSGKVTATLQWYPAQGMDMASDPPCSQLLIEEDAFAYAAGGVNGGADDTWSDGIGTNNVDTIYDVYDSSTGTVTVTDYLSASTPTAPGPPYNAGAAEVSVDFSVAYTPVEVDLAGTTLVGDNLEILTGQQVVATLSPANPNPTYRVSGWNWSTAAADAFKDYNPDIALTPPTPNQLVALKALDMQQSGFDFYTKSATDAKVTCTATVTCPDNTPLNVTASRPLQSVKPTAAMTLNDPPATFQAPGVQVSIVNPPSLQAYEYWWPATITVPAPFTGGTGCFSQIVESSTRVNTRAPKNNGAATYTNQIQQKINGNTVWIAFQNDSIDPTFIYPVGYTKNGDGTFTKIAQGPYTWPAGDGMYSFDSPGGTVAPTDIDNGGTGWNEFDVNESFQTWVMYKPPPVGGQGTVWVPVESLAWNWIAQVAPNDMDIWVTLQDPVYNPGNPTPSDDPPQWAYSDSTAMQRPALPGQ